MIELNLSVDNSEIVSYNYDDFPIRAQLSLLSDYPDMAAVSHWHRDWEFIFVLNGKMSYSVNGNVFEIDRSNGIFVNSKQIHYGYSKDGSDCCFICILLNPSLLTSLKRIEDSYYLPILNSFANSYCILDSSEKWQNELLEALNKIYKLSLTENSGFELQIMSLIYHIYYLLHNNLSCVDCDEKFIGMDKKLETIHNMIGYIQKNYTEKITLQDISNYGKVCRSTCCSLFQTHLGKTPISYLTQYRLEKSLNLLQNSNLTITEISMKCGFSGSSYFTETFRKKLGCTPSEYRKKKIKP